MVKCRVCETLNSHDKVICLQCNWELSKYNLSSYGFRTERRNKLQWARDTWLELHDIRIENKRLESQYKELKSWHGELESRYRELESRYEELESRHGKLKSHDEELQSRLKARYPKISLESGKYIDTSQLDEFLRNQEWEKADKETSYLILEVYGLQDVGHINKIDFHDYYYDLSANDSLKNINELWVLHSNNKFGFTVQLSIYKSIVEKINSQLDEKVNEKIFKQKYFDDFKQSVGWYEEYGFGLYRNSYEKMFDDFHRKNLELPDGLLPILRAGTHGENRDKRIHAFWQLFE
ncbi:MAG: GUN4 domain-containing protein [Nostocales cyanobacterium 94392]|nr:GUN4 domain-containing protein [Nostocales cyanobacterium 94392]